MAQRAGSPDLPLHGGRVPENGSPTMPLARWLWPMPAAFVTDRVGRGHEIWGIQEERRGEVGSICGRAFSGRVSVLARLSDCARFCARFYVRSCALAVDPSDAEMSKQQARARTRTKADRGSRCSFFVLKQCAHCARVCAVAVSESSAVSGISETPKPADCLGFEWLPFLDTYRTMCRVPGPEFQQLLEQVRDLPIAA
jgi:hypothetical protein